MEHIGEVVESSTKEFVARSPKVGESPPFGSFIKTNTNPVVYGIVYDIITDSREPNRQKNTYGISIEELRREQPQLFELLKTEFHVLSFAYLEDGKTKFSLPPLPPTIHSLVYICEKEEIERLSAEDFFLRTIISSPNIPVDDLIISSLSHAQDAREFDKGYVVRMGKSLSRFFRNDYERLSSILRRVV